MYIFLSCIFFYIMKSSSSTNETSVQPATAPAVVNITWPKLLIYCWKQITRLSKYVMYFSVLFTLLQVYTYI